MEKLPMADSSIAFKTFCMDHQYVDEKKVSEITGRALPTLRNDRHNRRGIPYCKVGRSVRYAVADVISFMESKKITFEDGAHTA